MLESKKYDSSLVQLGPIALIHAKVPVVLNVIAFASISTNVNIAKLLIVL